MCKNWERGKKSKIPNIYFNLVTSCVFCFNSISLPWSHLHCTAFLRCWPPPPHVLQRPLVHIIVTEFLIFVSILALALPFPLGSALLLQGKWTLLPTISDLFHEFLTLLQPCFHIFLSMPLHHFLSPQKKAKMQCGFIILQPSPSLCWSER